jgi:peptide/nickel transport system substrate-binding protein
MKTVSAVDRAIGLLWAIHDEPGVRLSPLARAVDLTPSTATRLLGTLQSHRLVVRDDEKGYRVGPALFEIVDTVPRQPLADVLHADVATLANTTAEQVSLAVEVGGRAVHVVAVDGARPAGHDIILSDRAGHSDEDPATSAALAVLAEPEPRGDSVVRGRANGGVEIAAAVLDSGHRIVGAICLHLPPDRAVPSNVRDRALDVTRAAMAATVRLSARSGRMRRANGSPRPDALGEVVRQRGPRRRTFLVGVGTTTAGLALAACSGPTTPAAGGGQTTAGGGRKGSATTALPSPATYREAPALAASVKAGDLPPVADRLPRNPYVVPHRWLEPGVYGGRLRMLLPGTSGNDASAAAEFFYGYSLLRFLNDGQDIGPGIVEKWSANADTSTWTFHFREGLRWSDGHPWSTADIMFWWKDMANDADFVGQAVPDECKNADGTPATLTAADPHTLTISFKGPAPLTADRLATWTNGYGGNGPAWMVPSHFARAFHPRHTKGLPPTWAAVGGLFETSVSYRRNPKCPTLAGFRLAEYNDARSLVWERNPYYYAVTPDGDQLPYIDGITMTAVTDGELTKLKISQGDVDLSHGPLNGVTLADVSTLMKNRDRADIDVYLWNSGSGVGSGLALSQDYHEEKYRVLIREPRFRQALSLAFDRAQARKTIFFEKGELSTGTTSPRAIEFSASDDGQQVFSAWRDSWVAHDPQRAQSMLDDLGLVDTDEDGYREFPDGSALTIRIDMEATASIDHVQKNNQLVRDWKAIGVRARVNPVSPASVQEEYRAGKQMTRSTINVPDAPAILSYPQWLVPIDTNQWAPMQGQMYAVRGTPAEHSEADVDPYDRKPPRMAPERDGVVAKLWSLYDRARVEPDAVLRAKLVWEMAKLHTTEGPFFIGAVANAPTVFVKKRGLKNVPTREQLAFNGYSLPYVHPTPAVYDPEAFFWDDPSKHNV